jgi:quinolinate synthetase A subunit
MGRTGAAALDDAKEDEVREKVFTDLGIEDNDDNKELNDKLVNRELDQRKVLSKAISQKIKLREQITGGKPPVVKTSPTKVGNLTIEEIQAAKIILWRGHCSVHGRFTKESVDEVRNRLSGVQVLVHPECQHEVVRSADVVGSTEFIIKTVEASPAGSKWAIGTELNLVSRLAKNNPDKQIVFLDKTVCYCSTMNRIDLPHLVWAMESLVSGNLVNQIKVDENVAKYSKLALERMLSL